MPAFNTDRSWLAIDGPDHGDHFDACGWDCLATVVAAEIALTGADTGSVS